MVQPRIPQGSPESFFSAASVLRMLFFYLAFQFLLAPRAPQAGKPPTAYEGAWKMGRAMDLYVFVSKENISQNSKDAAYTPSRTDLVWTEKNIKFGDFTDVRYKTIILAIDHVPKC